MHAAQLGRLQNFIMRSGKNFMRLCACLFAQCFESFCAPLIADQIHKVFEQDQLERIGCDGRLGLAVMRRELRNDLR